MRTTWNDVKLAWNSYSKDCIVQLPVLYSLLLIIHSINMSFHAYTYMMRYVQWTFWTLFSGKICKYCCWCFQYSVSYLVPAMTSYFVFCNFLVNYSSYRYSSLDIFYVLLIRNPAVKNLGASYGTTCIFQGHSIISEPNFFFLFFLESCIMQK